MEVFNEPPEVQKAVAALERLKTATPVGQEMWTVKDQNGNTTTMQPLQAISMQLNGLAQTQAVTNQMLNSVGEMLQSVAQAIGEVHREVMIATQGNAVPPEVPVAPPAQPTRALRVLGSGRNEGENNDPS